MMHNPRFTRIHSSPKETQLQTCCVSFGKDCTLRTELSMGNEFLLGIIEVYHGGLCIAWDEARCCTLKSKYRVGMF